MGLDGVGDDMVAEIGQGIVKQFADEFAIENVNAHRGEQAFAAVLDFEFCL